MNLNFIYGKAYSSLKEECIKEIQSDINNVNIDKITIISDEVYKKEIEIEIRSKNILDPKLKIQVTTVKELCANTINNFGDRRIKVLNEDEELALLVDSINKVKDSLHLYKNLILDSTFINSIKSTISKFKREQVTPEVLEEKCLSLNNQLTKDKLKDFITIYKEYVKNSINKYLDSDDKVAYTSNLLQNNSNNCKNKIHIYKLDNISDLEIELIKNLINKDTDINVFVTNDDFDREPSNLSGAFFKTDSFVTKLKRLCNEDCDINSKYIEIDAFSTELEHLEGNLFSYPYSEYKEQPQNIFLTECSSIDNEIERITNSIEILRDSGEKLDTITVGVSNINQYERSIKNIFNKCSIPYSISVSKNLGFHPFARFIELTIKLYEDKTNETLLRLLKTGYTQMSIENIGIFEKYLNSNECIYIDEIDIEELVRVKFNQEDYFKSLIESFNVLFSLFDLSSDFNSLYKGLFELLESNNIIETIKERIDCEFENDNESKHYKYGRVL